MTVAEGTLARLVRDEGPRVLASLVRATGSLQIAEDAVQDAVVRALEVWPVRGIPDQPRAWLTLTARRRAIDLLRREARRSGREADAGLLAGLARTEPLPGAEVIADDLLRLLFTVCHPALATEVQVALALRTLCGLTTTEIARSLLVSEAALAKRMTRGRRKIADAGIPYRTPSKAELPTRLSGVASTIYVVFTHGHDAVVGDSPERIALCDQAIRLGRLTAELLPGDPSITGLLALMLLQDSRRRARLDEAGDVVLLRDQDRSRWDRARIGEGMALLGQALRSTPSHPDPYVVQAAIAACHAVAEDWESTNWAAIVSWYDVLLTVHDTPVVRLNRAVALSERDGPGAGLVALEALASAGRGGMDGFAPYHAARGHMLLEMGHHADAELELRRALRGPTSGPVERHLLRQLARCRSESTGPP
ncbi:MAG: sigma-70 family RNA polymerase sigma factor [Acidobacteriota bacterium]|nr:sigma-70 family RNA polymerase sigma factor [Acidobacteriota bacterium]